MSWWKGNPDLSRYYRDLDRKYDERRRELDIDLLRTRSDLAGTSHRMAAAERARRRARYRQDAERERDWIEREFRHCAHFRKETCAEWADRTARLARGAADDAAQLRQLLDDFQSATEGYQRELRGLISMLGGRSPVTLLPGGPPIGPSGFALPVLGPDANLRWLRAEIHSCRQLRDETRYSWLAELPPPPRPGAIGLGDVPVSTLQGLCRQVALEARYAATQADLICSSLKLLQTYVTGYTG